MDSSVSVSGGIAARRIISVGAPGPGHRWAEKLSTSQGERVAKIVGALSDVPISLALEVPNLALEASGAFIGISPNAVGVASVSVSGFLRSTMSLPIPIRKQVVSAFAAAVCASVIIPLKATFRRAMGEDCDADIACALAVDDDEIGSADVIMPDAGLSKLAEYARMTVRHAIAYQALLVARSRFDLADKIGEFTRLMRMGNVPLGITSERDLIVLVA